MSSTRPSLGSCPHCEIDVPRFRLLIKYETDEGVGVFAECPSCRDVVSPV